MPIGKSPWGVSNKVEKEAEPEWQDLERKNRESSAKDDKDDHGFFLGWAKRIVVLGFVGLISYFGGGALLIKSNSIQQNRKLYFSESFPKILKPLIQLYCPEATVQSPPSFYTESETPSGSSSYGSSSYSSSELEDKINEIEEKIRRGEIPFEEGRGMIEGIGDIYLGKGKTGRIMDIMEQQCEGKISEVEAMKKIVDEVPTGLPEPLDKAIKEFGKRYGERFWEDINR